MEAPPFPKVKLPTIIEPFDGTTDPDDHLSAYKHQMYVQGVDDATWCKNFPATLKGVAQKWFNNLPPNSVNNFTELSILFTSHFVANRQEQKPSMHLGKVVQGPKEALRSYVKSFKFDLVKKKISTLTEALKEAEAFIHATEVCAEAKHMEAKKVEEAAQPKKSVLKKAETWAMTSMTTTSKRTMKSEPAASAEPIEFSKDQYSILMEIKDQHELKAPAELKTPYRNKDKSKYCHFQKDCGHETNECKHLKRALEDLARKGKMNSYLSQSSRKFQKRDDHHGRRKDDESTDEDVVMVISGGFAAGGPTNRGHKNYLRELSQVMLTNQAKADPFPKIVVSEQDRGNIRTPHDDPLVVEMKIANLRVRRILIDTGSSTDIISADCLSRLKFDENELVPINHPIIGFGGGVIHPTGTVTLPVRVGDKEAGRTLFVKFLVVRDLTAYNIILRRHTLNHIKAVIVTHLMLMKFECDGGKIGSLYGDQQAARECYLTTLKPSSWKGEKSERPRAMEDEPVEKLKRQISESKQEVEKAQMKPLPESKSSMILPNNKRCLAIKEEKNSSEEIMAIMSLGLERPEPVESPVEVCLNPERPERMLKIGSVLGPQTKDALVTLLTEFEDFLHTLLRKCRGLIPKSLCTS
ncbi:uncharacterized protein LOC125498620 [Beta vulgaris subsp. vulgaris]|uniref:uncharacterized protein LOC125498620 n=1 Tax=Beta vulgaris subsp. vulgaris TaxID=3555 RepID=UPI00203726BF|nr:uncharacterized protein LOC125498620 [Beta vulgaris subsp. vulgaris]